MGFKHYDCEHAFKIFTAYYIMKTLPFLCTMRTLRNNVTHPSDYSNELHQLFCHNTLITLITQSRVTLC